MPQQTDSLFIEMAIAKGYMDRAQADEALSIERATAGDGTDRRLFRDILVEEGWMTEEQVKEIDAQLTDTSAHTGQIEGYRLLAKVGQGGMGAVYRAERTATGEVVALKILPRRMAQKTEFVERFLREARSASKMKSPHIVRPVDVGFSGGYYYFAMEFVEGESVDTTLSIDGAMAESRALRIVHQIAQALVDAHRAGMLHRDIKPGNILVTSAGVAKLTDFGLAREVEDQSATQAGITVGTPNYMSPEQARATKALDIRSDIYSLGVTFYHMVTGVVPFRGETSMLTMLKHLNEAPVAPISRRPDLSRSVNDIILKMLAKKPEDRYRSPEDLVTDLELAMAGKPPLYALSTEPKPEEEEESPPAGQSDMQQFAAEMRRQGRLQWLKTGAVVGTICLMALTAWILRPKGDGGPQGKKVDPAEQAAVQRESEARQRLLAVRKFAEQNPHLLAEIAARFAEVEKTAPQVTAKEAGQLRSEAERKLTAAIDAKFRECDEEAKRLAQEDKFGEAIAAYDNFPSVLRTPKAVSQIDRARENLQKMAWDKFTELEAQATRLIQAKKLTAARDVITRALTFGISGITAKTKEIIARIDTESIAAGTERESQMLEAYRAAVSKVRAFVRGGQFDQALVELQKERQRATDESIRKKLASHLPTIIAARMVWASVMKGVAALQPGYRIDTGTVTATFVSYDPKTEQLTFRTNRGRTVMVLAGWLPPAYLKDLATAGAGGAVPPIELAALFLARGDTTEAAREIEAARTANAQAPSDATTEILKRYDEQLALLQKSREEIEADNLLAKARQQAAAEPKSPEQTARTLWELAARYSTTRCFAQNRDEIEGLLARAEAESITVDTLFSGTQTELADGVSELKYDFSDPAQAADWPNIWKNRSYGRWAIHHIDGEMVAESGLVYFKVPFRGDFEAALKVRDARQLSIRLGMPEPVASPRTAGISFTWKREGAGSVSSVEEAGKTIGTPRTEPKFLVVGALDFAIELKGGTLIIKVGDTVAHRVTVKSAGSNAPTPGYLVLDGFNLGARITSIVIRTKHDRAWLETNFVEPLRKEKLEEARWRMADSKSLLDGNDASAWRLTSSDSKATWTFARGYAMAPEGISCAMTVGDMNWGDYAFSAKVRVGTAPGAVRMLVRWTDAPATGGTGKGYYAELAAGRGTTGAGGTITLGKASGDRVETLRQANVNLTNSDWYQVHFEVRGTLVRVLLGGQEVVSAEDDSYATGRVGLASFRSGAHFSDIRIKLTK